MEIRKKKKKIKKKKREYNKHPLSLTLVVLGTSKNGAAEIPSISSLLDPKKGAVDSRPLVSSFILYKL